jgi:polyhydroxybutyrate depolymerase
MQKLLSPLIFPVYRHPGNGGLSFPFTLLVILVLTITGACGRSQTVQPVPTGLVETIPSVTLEASPSETVVKIPSEALGTVPSEPIETAIPTSKPLLELGAGDHALTMIYDGLQRSYVIHIPPGLDPSRPVPMVLAFHGLGLNASEMNRISGFSDQSDSSGFIVIYPEGTGETKSWNGGHCCGTAARDRVDDVGFVRALIGELSTTLPIDTKQIHATGFSNGAIFTYRLACELSDLIASFGPVSATPAEDDLQTCAPPRAVPLMHFHGTADDPNPYDGGQAPGGFYFVPVDTAIQFWTGFNGCPTPPQTTESGSIRHDSYAPCESGSAVELYTIMDGKHAWPGGEAVNQKMGEPNMEISATALLWDFFRSHPMP